MEFLKKNAGLIITVLVIGFVVWYFFLRKKKSTESGYWTDAKCKRMGCTGLGSDGRCTGCHLRSASVTGTSESGYAISCPRGWKQVGNKCIPEGGTTTTSAAVYPIPGTNRCCPQPLVNGWCQSGAQICRPVSYTN